MKWHGVLLFLLLLHLVAGGEMPAQAGFPAAEQTMEIPVNQSFHGDKFSYRMQLDRTTPYYSVYRLTYPGVAGKELFGPITANYYVPAAVAADPELPPRPGVVALHILGGNGALTNLLCANLATNGIPAIMFHMPLFASRCPGGSRAAMLSRPDAARIFGQALELALEDASRTIDVMLTRPEINPHKINLLGTSMGGIIGATVTERDGRIDKAALLLAGGDLPQIIGYSQETAAMRKIIDNAAPADQAYLKQILTAVDPLTKAEKLRPLANSGRLMMVNAEADEVVPPACTEALARQSGMDGRLRVIPGVGHYTAIAALPQQLTDFVKFFGDDTIPEIPPPPATGDQQAIREIFGQLSRLAKFSPDPDYGFWVDAAFTVEDTGSHRQLAKGTVMLLRGTGRQFLLTVQADQLPQNIPRLQLGFGKYPWVVAGSGTVYQGSLEPDNAGPGSYLDAKLVLYQGMAAGIFDMAAKGMLEPLEQWCKMELRRDDTGKRCLAIDIQGRQHLDIYLQDSGNIPQQIVYTDGKTRTEIVLRHWDMAAPADAAAYQPPTGRGTKVVEVRQKDLNRMLAAVCNFMIEGN